MVRIFLFCGLVTLGIAGSAPPARADTDTGADTGDSGDTDTDTDGGHDTSVYVDTGAESERVLVQDVGCGRSVAAVWIGSAALLLGAGRRRPSRW
jgi:hypothetical protein